MKVLKISLALFAVFICIFALLAFTSHRKALAVGQEVLPLALGSRTSYEKTCDFQLFDPFSRWVPFWHVVYSEVPTEMYFDTPSLDVTIFSQVYGNTKDVYNILISKGYSEEN